MDLFLFFLPKHEQHLPVYIDFFSLKKIEFTRNQSALEIFSQLHLIVSKKNIIRINKNKNLTSATKGHNLPNCLFSHFTCKMQPEYELVVNHILTMQRCRR